MRKGTPGFVGSRLREAREARGFSVAQVAELISVTVQTIYAFERGTKSPHPDKFGALATALNMPTEFFFTANRPTSENVVFYRSMAAATKTARRRAEHRFEWLHDIVRYVSDTVVLPEVTIPCLDVPTDPMLLSTDDIEHAAQDLRTAWGLRDHPIGSVVRLIENHGAIVARDRFGAETLDSLSRWSDVDDRPYVVIGTDRGTTARWRFDAAHELGHLVLHRDVPREVAQRPELHKLIEGQAHRFAGAFLLPRDAFADELFSATLDALQTLKVRWKVSIAMMVTRARQLELISEDTQKSLMVSISKRGWRRSEPFDSQEEMPVEEPTLLRRSLELILEAGTPPAEILAALRLSEIDVETLANLPIGFLAGTTVPVLRRAPDPEAGSVIAFPTGGRRS